jgi:hypothetical protein
VTLTRQFVRLGGHLVAHAVGLTRSFDVHQLVSQSTVDVIEFADAFVCEGEALPQ